MMADFEVIVTTVDHPQIRSRVYDILRDFDGTKFLVYSEREGFEYVPMGWCDIPSDGICRTDEG